MTVDPARITEKQCTVTIVKAAKLLGWKVHQQPKLKDDPGWPGLTLVRNNQLWFVTVKRRPDRVTQAEKRWLAALSVDGANTHVVWCPAGVDSFLTMLARPGARPT